MKNESPKKQDSGNAPNRKTRRPSRGRGNQARSGDQGGKVSGKGHAPRGGKSAASKHGKGAKGVPSKGEHILFVGFMGCGKSSVSRVLSKHTGLPLIDIDKYIEKTEGKRIKDIFAEVGESGFRKIETQALAGLAFEPKSIISCGGGICGSVVNRAIVKALGTVVYLKVPCQEAIDRISDPSTRPMLSGPRPVQEIYDERLPLYQSVADITINTSGKSVGQNTQSVFGALKYRKLI